MMQRSPANLIADSVYQILWRLILPFLRHNHRLAQGFDQRRLSGKHLHKAGLWIQSASAGEAYLAWEILKKISMDRPLKILATTNTSQGLGILEQAKAALSRSNTSLSLECAYFPFDSPAIMQRAIKMVRPRLMVLLETELWPALMIGLKQQGCRIAVINARMTRRSLKHYMLWPSFWQRRRPDHILAISNPDRSRFTALFGNQGLTTTMPNIKFDRLDDGESLLKIKSSNLPTDNFLILGSIRMLEEAQVEQIIQRILSRRPNAVLGLFPRHMHRLDFWQRSLKRLGIDWVRRSTQETLKSGGVVLWDVFGELGTAYLGASAAFVGGSLVKLGGQNFLEPLVKGVPTIIGPYWDNFKWVGNHIIHSGILHQADSWKDVADFLLARIMDPIAKEPLQNKAQAFIRARQGGTEKACALIRTILDQPQKR